MTAQGRLLMRGLGDGSPTISKMGGFATKGLHIALNHHFVRRPLLPLLGLFTSVYAPTSTHSLTHSTQRLFDNNRKYRQIENIDNAKWNTEQKREGDPLLRLWCSIIPNLDTGIYNSATNQKKSTIIYT